MNCMRVMVPGGKVSFKLQGYARKGRKEHYPECALLSHTRH